MRRIAPDAALAGVVFLAAATGSAVTWVQLAERTSWSPALAWVPFVSIDVAGLYFGHNWITGRKRLRTWGRVATLGDVAVSVAGNGIEHALAGGFLRVTIWLTIAVGTTPAVALFAVVHQWSLKRDGDARAARPGRAPEPGPAAVATTPAPGPAGELGERRADHSTRVEWLLAREGLSWTEQVDAVMTEFSVSRSTAKRTVDAAREGVAS